MKKIISMMAAMAVISTFSATSVNATLQESYLDGFDYYTSRHIYCRDPYTQEIDGEYWLEHHYVMDDVYGGLMVEITTQNNTNSDQNWYDYVVVEVNDDAALDALREKLGKTVDSINWGGHLTSHELPSSIRGLGENEYAFLRSSDLDCTELYDIPGVETVRLAKHLAYKDAWLIDKNDEDPLVVSVVVTENEMNLTPEMFADTGYDIVETYQIDSENNKWGVQYRYKAENPYFGFDIEAEKIDGILSSALSISYDTRENAPTAAYLQDVPRFGDIDENGTINASDAAVILQISAMNGAGKEDAVTEIQKQCIDVDGDGEINASDAAIVLMYSASTGSGAYTDTLKKFVGNEIQ